MDPHQLNFSIETSFQAEKEIKSYLMSTLKEHYHTQQEANAVTASWNLLQVLDTNTHLIMINIRLLNSIEFQGQLSCCGVNNFTDFNGTPWMKNKTSNHLLPASCCKLSGKLIDFQPADPTCQSSPTDDNSYRMKV